MRTTSLQQLREGPVVCLAIVLLACSAGDSAEPAAPAAEPDPAAVERSAVDQLAALGYVATEPLPERTGVTLYDPTRAYRGWNLVVSQRGRRARLMDIHGRTLHVWQRRTSRPGGQPSLWWRTVRLFPNGDLLAQTDFGPLVKLDRDSRVLWEFDDRTHHDFDVRDDGHIFVLTSEMARFPGFGKVSQDFVVELDPNGRELRRVSVLQALIDGQRTETLAAILRFQRGAKPLQRMDPTHTNAVEVLDGGPEEVVPAFRPGNLLISVPTVGRLLVLDFEAGRVVWSLDGSFVYQHDPTVLANGHLLLFDNRGLGERSRVLEIDPVSGDEVWSYGGSAADDFYSACCGRARRLPNGNTLIVDAKPGRAFEVTARGRVAWEYQSPDEIRGRVAILNDVVRIAPEQAPWLSEDEAVDGPS